MSVTGNVEENEILQEQFVFEGDYTNEYEAFIKYYEVISKTGVINKILKEIEEMDDYCELFEGVMNGNKSFSEELNLYFDAIPIKKRNKNILYSCDLLKLETSVEKGRHLIATDDVPKDTIVINELPAVLQVNPLCQCVGNSHSSLYRCHNCGMACRQFYTCTGCNVCIFCSRTCLSEAYRNYHRYECYGLQRHFWSTKDTDYHYLALRMMLHGTCQHFNTDINPDAPYGHSVHNYPFIYGLETNFNRLSSYEVNKILYGTVRNLLYLVLKTTYFEGFKTKIEAENLHLYIGGVMVRHYCHAQMNNIILKYPNYSSSWGLDVVSGTGKAICPTIALINHSCAPNCVIVVCANYLLVKTLRDVERGEEITVCYGEVDALMTYEERQLITEEILCFSCRCSFCKYERKSNHAPYKCLLCQSGAARKIKDDEGNLTAHCLECNEYFPFEEIMKNIRIASVCRSVYDATSSIEHLIRLSECYTSIFPYKSLQMLDVYKLLYDKYVAWEAKPFEALKYGLLVLNIIEHCIPPLYIPLLLAKVKFMVSFVDKNKFKHQKKVTAEEHEIIKIFANEVMKVKKDLLFYVPYRTIISFDRTVKQVHHMFQKCMTDQVKKTKKK